MYELAVKSTYVLIARFAPLRLLLLIAIENKLRLSLDFWMIAVCAVQQFGEQLVVRVKRIF